MTDINTLENLLIYNNYFFPYKYGWMNNITNKEWLLAGQRLLNVIENIGYPLSSFHEVNKWLMPLFSFYIMNNITEHIVLDMGCGSSIILRDSILQGATIAYGIDLQTSVMPSNFKIFGCNILDINKLRYNLSLVENPIDFLVCTEVLEHLEFNPLPSFLLTVEMLHPKYIYVTAPTCYYPGGFQIDWMHYKKLPCWRGEKTYSGLGHYKGWAYDELEDLMTDLGYKITGGIWANWRVMALGEKIV